MAPKNWIFKVHRKPRKPGIFGCEIGLKFKKLAGLFFKKKKEEEQNGKLYKTCSS